MYQRQISKCSVRLCHDMARARQGLLLLSGGMLAHLCKLVEAAHGALFELLVINLLCDLFWAARLRPVAWREGCQVHNGVEGHVGWRLQSETTSASAAADSCKLLLGQQCTTAAWP